ncbi:hypothetical protein F503_06445 [Ophiostoma piceae UAMH 11346]|uniref:Uncharacterized protein n=1 Tax=Ophiostoma piceae (strain UAMH 11346) TaxID=1262450 RepID=S3BR74_OPHP1|nr:hypothetical protein F503_06445 [Ophiostoma piceae UAMH 11346]
MIRLRPTTLCVTIEEVHCLDLRQAQSSPPRVVCMPSRTQRIFGKDAHHCVPQTGVSVAGQSLPACEAGHGLQSSDEHGAGGSDPQAQLQVVGEDVVMTTNEMAPLAATPPRTRLVRPHSASTLGYSPKQEELAAMGRESGPPEAMGARTLASPSDSQAAALQWGSDSVSLGQECISDNSVSINALQPGGGPGLPSLAGAAYGSPSRSRPMGRRREGAEGSHSSSDVSIGGMCPEAEDRPGSVSDASDSAEGSNSSPLPAPPSPPEPSVRSTPQTPTSATPYSLRRRYVGAFTAPVRSSRMDTSGSNGALSPSRRRSHRRRRRRQYVTAVETQEAPAE